MSFNATNFPKKERGIRKGAGLKINQSVSNHKGRFLKTVLVFLFFWG